MPGVSWPELSIVLVWVIGATIFVIQKTKMLVCTHWKGAWTQKIPKWVWLAASIAIPFGLVVLICQQWAQDLINPMLPESLRLHFTDDAILPTALSATLGANGSYVLAKKAGITGDYSAGGPNDVTTNKVTIPTSPPEPPVTAPVATSDIVTEPVVASTLESKPADSEKITLFLKVIPPATSQYYALFEDTAGQHIYPVEVLEK